MFGFILISKSRLSAKAAGSFRFLLLSSADLESEARDAVETELRAHPGPLVIASSGLGCSRARKLEQGAGMPCAPPGGSLGPDAAVLWNAVPGRLIRCGVATRRDRKGPDPDCRRHFAHGHPGRVRGRRENGSRQGRRAVRRHVHSRASRDVRKRAGLRAQENRISVAGPPRPTFAEPAASTGEHKQRTAVADGGCESKQPFPSPLGGGSVLRSGLIPWALP